MDKLFGIPMDTLAVVSLAAFIVLVGAVAGVALRNRILLKLALRNIERRRGRTVLIVGGLMLGTTIIAAALNTGDTMTNTVRSTALTSLGHIDEIISVEGADTNSDFFMERATEVRYFDQDLFPLVEEAARNVDLIDGLTPAIIEPVAVQDVATRQSEPRATVFAAEPGRLEGFGEIKTVEGEVATLAELEEGEVYLNADAGDELAANPGDELLVFAAGKPAPLRVRAVVDYEGTGTEGSALIMPLPAAQALLDREGEIKHILVSNQGNAMSGAEHTEAVIAALEPTLGPLGLEADSTKADSLDFAEQLGDVFTTLFVTVGSFSIIAGILLIFLIFVMLAEERKSEMGMARAVGTKRSQLIQMFVYEGVAYDLVAAAVGAAVGLAVAYGMVFVMAKAFATFGIDIEHDLRLRSVVVAYTLGMLLTFVVVTVSAWRVSVLNIVRAIRNLPEPALRRGGGYTWLLGVLGVGLGVLLVYAGVSAEQGTPFYLGVSLAVIGLVPLMRRLGVPDRPAYTLPGVALVVWWLLPFDTFEFVLPELSMDMTIFILSGVMVVTGATWAVMYNSDVILTAVMAVFGRVRGLAASLKTAVSYPLTSRFRTGVTLAMFTLVVFTLVVMSTISNAFTNAFNDEESFGGGFDIRATTVSTSRIEDFSDALGRAEGVNAEDVEVVASQSFLSLQMRQEDLEDRDFESYALRGLDEEFMASATYEFAAIAQGYESSDDVWQALAEDPGLAIVDPLPVPRRENFGFQPQSDFQLEGFYVEDERFSPVDVRVRDEQSDTTFSVKIIGVLKDTVPEEFMFGVATSQERLPLTLGSRAQPTVHFIRLAEGADAQATARALEAAFLENGLEVDVLAEELETEVATNRAFNYILQGFMGLGLVVGVAALGVISARSVVERRQQIGVLRAIGFKRHSVQLAFLLESSFIALLGIVVGTLLGLVMAFNVIDDARQQSSWDNMSFAVPWANLLIIFAIVYAGALVAAYFPARQAARVYPAEALRYE